MTTEDTLARLERLESLLLPEVTPQALPPSVVAGELIQASWGNGVITALGNRARTLTNSGVGDRIHVQARDAVVSTNAAGDGTVAFNETFPNVPTVVAMMSSGGTPGPSQYISLTAVTATQFTFRAFVNGTTAYQGAIRITYIAVSYNVS